MDKILVDSRDISHVGHDEGSEILRIWFHSGGVYEYDGVPRSEYDGLMSATSHGKYFHQHIKDKYSYRKLG